MCCPLGGGVTHGLTEATDGRLVGELEIEARLAAEQVERSSTSVQPNTDSVASLDQSSGAPLNFNTRIHRCWRANTIDFAQREKDEMRDLTRASEILTVGGSDDREVQVVCDFLSSSPLCLSVGRRTGLPEALERHFGIQVWVKCSWGTQMTFRCGSPL